jgi:hypothetical protein
VDGICRPAKKPVFAGEEGICAGHPVHQLLRPGLHHRRDGRQDPEGRVQCL